MSTLTANPRRPSSILLLVVFLALVIGVGGVIGYMTAPGEWYAGLRKPPFNPPNWLFGPVWFVLYVLIAFAGWRTALRAPTGTAMRFWIAQMILNWAWSPVWFGLHLVWPAFAIIIGVLLTIIGFIWSSWREDRASALMFVPYLVWVAFASTLNLSIGLLN